MTLGGQKYTTQGTEGFNLPPGHNGHGRGCTGRAQNMPAVPNYDMARHPFQHGRDVDGHPEGKTWGDHAVPQGVGGQTQGYQKRNAVNAGLIKFRGLGGAPCAALHKPHAGQLEGDWPHGGHLPLVSIQTRRPVLPGAAAHFQWAENNGQTNRAISAPGRAGRLPVRLRSRRRRPILRCAFHATRIGGGAPHSPPRATKHSSSGQGLEGALVGVDGPGVL